MDMILQLLAIPNLDIEYCIEIFKAKDALNGLNS